MSNSRADTEKAQKYSEKKLKKLTCYIRKYSTQKKATKG
jgi:hypothetical protein